VRAGVSGIPSRQPVLGQGAEVAVATSDSYARSGVNILAVWLALRRCGEGGFDLRHAILVGAFCSVVTIPARLGQLGSLVK